MKIYPFSKLLLFALFSFLLILPVAAQETTEVVDLEIGVEMTFTGNIHFDTDGNIYIDGYFLAPAGTISPSLLTEGQYVEVTGIFLNDDTFKLIVINTEIEEPTCDSTGATEDTADDCPTEPTCDSTGATEDTADDCPTEPTCDSTGATADTADDCPTEPTCDSTGATADTADDCPTEPTCDSTGTTEDTADDCPLEEEECTPNGHPVAARIADAFDVSPCEVEAQHDAGNGFGNIAKAYLLAEAYNQALLDGLLDDEEIDPALLLDAQAYLDMHSEGVGWGQIVKASGVHPSDLAPGKLKKRAANDDDSEDEDTTDDSDATTQTVTTETSNNGNNGNSNSNSNSNNGNGNNGNNGNSNGNNGNGNSNANANSNNGNNGNGNGNNGNGNGKNKEKKNKKNK